MLAADERRARSNVDIRFLGAAREVTGSCFLVRTGGRELLVDCGMIQGGVRDEARNHDPFPFEPGSIDAVVLSHAHLDHSGRLPQLVRQGFRGTLYTHRASRDLLRIMLKDAASLAERDAESENRKRARKGLKPVAPLYTRTQAEATVRRVRALDYGDAREILPGARLTLHDAGHILGSAIVELALEERGVRRTIVFSGDLGHRGAPLLRDPVRLRAADLVVLESTYGDRNHRSWEETCREIGDVFREAERERGNILIPAFAIGRSQELLYLFRRHYHEWGLAHWAIFLDSPMAIEATEVYARHWRLYDAEARQERHDNGDAFRMPNLRFTRTAAQSAAINRLRSGAIIIAGSGMCTGGRIRHHLKHNLWRDSCHLVIAGFQARGTLGRRIVDGARHVRLWGETVRVAARVHTIGGLSAHAGQQDLLDWYGAFAGRPRVALVHGEDGAMQALAARLAALGAPVMTPERGERLSLD
jgi:metallo-beta-lactamase family protein